MDNVDRRRLEFEHRVLQCCSLCNNPRRRTLYPINCQGRKEGNCKLGRMVSPRQRFIWNASSPYIISDPSPETEKLLDSEAQRALGFNDLFKKIKPEVQDWMTTTVCVSIKIPWRLSH